MVSEKFKHLEKYIFTNEGGYVNNPQDKGGPTNFGIAYNYNKSILEQYGITRPEQMKLLTRTIAHQIYYDKYWRPSGAEEIPHDGLALLFFDTAVNAGILTAIKILDKLPKNIYHYESNGKNILYWQTRCIEYATGRHDYYSSLKDFQVFGQGWENRLWRMLNVAITLN